MNILQKYVIYIYIYVCIFKTYIHMYNIHSFYFLKERIQKFNFNNISIFLVAYPLKSDR